MTALSNQFQLAVIGAGPGGYVAAIRAAQLGLRTVVIEREALGGVCLNWGCIPSKAILRNAEVVSLFHRAQEFGVSFDNFTVDYSKAIQRSRRVVNRMVRGIAHLLRKNGVHHVAGEARFIDAHSLHVSPDDTVISAENIIIATGARPRTIPILPIDEQMVITSRQALEQADLPSNAVVLGGGAIGVEFASVYNSYGVNVTIVEMLPRLLPNEDAEISKLLERSLRRKGINIMTGARAFDFQQNGNSAVLRVETGPARWTCLAVESWWPSAFRATWKAWGWSPLALPPKEASSLSTTISPPESPASTPLATSPASCPWPTPHRPRGSTWRNGWPGAIRPPSTTWTCPRRHTATPRWPAWASRRSRPAPKGYDVKVGRFPYQASGKAAAMGESEGMVKLVADAAYGEILGAHMIGADATELLAEVSMTRMLEGGITELGWMVHAHPTLSEALKEASLDAAGASLHT